MKKVVSEYEAPPGAMVEGPYADACGWDPDPASPDYMSCTGPIPPEFAPGGKAGGDVVVTYEVEVIGTGTGSLSSLIYDFSGSSFHYNKDFGEKVVIVVAEDTDLTVDKTPDSQMINAGDDVVFTIAVTNNGPSTAKGVTLSDALPSGTAGAWVEDPDNLKCEITGGNQLDCDFGDVPAGESRTVTVSAPTDIDNCGVYDNTATASATNADDAEDDGQVTCQKSSLLVDKTPDSQTINAGDDVAFTIKVDNNGPGTAKSVTLVDNLPGGVAGAWVEDPDNSECTITGGNKLTCDFGDMAFGASKTVTVKAPTDYDNCGLYNNTAQVTSDSGDGDVDEGQVTCQKPDLTVDKTPDSQTINAGDDVAFTIKVDNAGPGTAKGVTLSDTLPGGVAGAWVEDPDNLNCEVTGGNQLNCDFGDMAFGASKTVTVKAPTDSDNCGVYDNTATVSSTNAPDHSDDGQVTCEKTDVAITKTADPIVVSYGDTVTYTLKAKNNGPGKAENVTVTDPLPAGVSFVSADAPCVNLSGTVTCELGTLDPGQEVTLEVRVKVDALTPSDPNLEHLLDVQKVEAQIDVQAGETKTVSVTCPSGYFASDGSVRIDQVDHGTGDWTTQQVLESRASSLDTWQGTVRNTATGRSQAKIFAVCIKQTTNQIDGHTHDITVSAPVVVSETVPAGPKEAVLPCPAGYVAIQPGFSSTAPADLNYSQPEGNGWKFVLDVKAPADVTFSIRCMSRQVTFMNGHDHNLDLERIWTEVTVQGNTVNEAQLTCPDGSKGIVGGWDLDPGLVSLGNDPRPVTRAFKLYNPTMGPLTARLSLLCLGNDDQR